MNVIALTIHQWTFIVFTIISLRIGWAIGNFILYRLGGRA